MQVRLYKLLALVCSVLTFFGVGNLFYSRVTPLSVFAAIAPIIGVIVFNNLSKK